MCLLRSRFISEYEGRFPYALSAKRDEVEEALVMEEDIPVAAGVVEDSELELFSIPSNHSGRLSLRRLRSKLSRTFLLSSEHMVGEEQEILLTW